MSAFCPMLYHPVDAPVNIVKRTFGGIMSVIHCPSLIQEPKFRG